jgi:hypothetical protein
LPDVVERVPVDVLLLRVPDEVPAIRAGWARLEEIVGLRGRHFFGVFDGTAGEYRVCVELREGDDPDALGLERGTIDGGRYLRGEPPAVYERIGPSVQALEALAGVDESRPVVERYRRHDEIDVLVPIA